MAERRPERVAHRVQAELATVFLREANDPRLRDLTVTAVRMSADLRVARVYVRTLGDTADARAGALRALARAATFLRGRVGRALGLRVTPELPFESAPQPDPPRPADDLLPPPKDGAGGEPPPSWSPSRGGRPRPGGPV